MCFSTRKYGGTKPNPLIATQDIVAYKIIKKDGWGKYYNLRGERGKQFKWEKGNWYYQTGRKFGFRRNIIDQWVIESGLHSSVNKPSSWIVRSDEIIIKVTIPEGAEYFKNEDSYCSDQLIYY